MNTALASNQPTSRAPARTSARMLARKGAIVMGLAACTVVAGLLALTPALMTSALLWASWAVAMTGVVAAYASGLARRRRLSGRQSRRIRRWIATSQR